MVAGRYFQRAQWFLGQMRLVLAFTCACALALASTGAASAAPAPGDVDLSFGNRGYVGGDVYPALAGTSMAVGPQGETFVLEPRMDPSCSGGGFCRVDLTVARFNRDGSRDPAFGAESKLSLYQVPYWRSEIAVTPDGKPVVAAISEAVLEKVGPGGATVSPLGKRSVVVARFGTDGLPDPSFGSFAGTATTGLDDTSGNTPALAVLPDGRVMVAAEANPESNPGSLAMSRLLPSGRLDPSFGEEGELLVALGTQSRPAGIAVRESSLVGSFDIGLSECCKGEGGLANGLTFARFLPNGGFDGSLAGDGSSLLARGQPSQLESIAAAGGGKLYAAIEEESRGSVLVRMLPGGALDASFGKGGEVALGLELGITGLVQIVPDNQGGVVGVSGKGAGVSVFRLRANGTPDRSFGAGRRVPLFDAGINMATSGVGLQPDGRIVVLGEWGAGTKGFYLARLAGGASKARCLGRRATIVGTRGRDDIVGTAGRDVIAALAGADRVRGLGSEDRICGGKGRDKLFGGRGRDKVRQ